MMQKQQTDASSRRQSLIRELQESNLFFDQLVDMIPAKLYVAGHSGDGIDYKSKYTKGQDIESKAARKARNKASKRAKYHPEMVETTNETKERLERNDEDNNDDDDSEDDDDDRERIRRYEKEEEEERKKKSSSDSASRIEALRAKLQAKLAEKRGHRPAQQTTDSNTISKRAARRAEKQRRKQEAMANAKKRGHAKLEEQKKTYVAAAASAAATPKSDLARMDFGKLTGLNEVDPGMNNKSLANLSKSKNLEKMLADAEAKRQRLEQLKKSDNAEDKAKAQSIQWGDVLKEAQGERVKDDPAKLRKAMKRKLAKKEKSRKAWASRLDQTKQAMDAKQAIRKHNLEKRKMGGATGANLSKKRIVEQQDASADGRRKKSRAGFEGKKQGFLNDKGNKSSTSRK